MATAIGLTDAKIKGIRPPEKGQAEYSDVIVPGLRVRVGTSGAKTFILRKRVGGRLSNMTLGRYHETRFTLADARKKARTLISDIEAGGDPVPKLKEEKAATGASGTVRALFDGYKRAKAENRTIGETIRVFEQDILPEIGDRMADTVTRSDITRLVDKVALRAPVQARLVAAQVSAFYSWALPRLDRLPANPARDAGRPPSPPARDRVLSDAELRALWKATDGEPFPWRAAIKLLILTGQRRDEVFSADRAEFDLKAKRWTIPGGRAKNANTHIVPLSTAAMGVFEAIPEIVGAPKLFPSRSDGSRGPSGFSKVMERLRAAVEKEVGEPVEPWRLHDLRRTMAIGMQRLGIRLEVTEAVLNHVSGSRAGIVGVYQRHDWLDEKQHALEAWAAEVDRIVQGKTAGGNVVKLWSTEA